MRGSGSAVSSISMSRNSSESKTSPQSWHSTNSVSSCRETMRTLGCLQAVAIGRGFDGKKVLFKPNCIGILPILKTISDESFYSFVFFIKRKGEFQAGACNSDINGRILNTDRSSRIFNAQIDQKSGLRADGAQVPGRAPGNRCAQR